MDQWNVEDDKLAYAATLTVPDLANLVMTLTDAYYNGESLVSDAEFDNIQEVLSLLDPENSVLKQVGAPVGTPSVSGNAKFVPENYPDLAGNVYTNPLWRQKIQLPFLMPSMDKSKPKDISKWNNWVGQNPGPYNISDKADGMSAGLIYTIEPSTNKVQVQLTSRGDGFIGEDLSAILPYLRVPGGSLPISPVFETMIREAQQGSGPGVQVRGEIIIPRERFEKAIGQGFALRNVVRGIIGGKTIRSGFLDLVDFLAYELVNPWPQTLTDGLTVLGDLGFTVINNFSHTGPLSLEELREMLLQRKADTEYEIDGLIVTKDTLPSRDIQKGDQFPYYAMAFKFDTDSTDTESALSIVKYVQWNSSKDGKLNPVAVIEPVGIGGVTISNVTMHNARYVTDMGIGPGAIVRVTRGGDVIPQIVASLRPVEPQMPTGVVYAWNDTARSISLANAEHNPEVMLSRVQYFFKKLGVPNWGDSNVKKIVDKNLPVPTDILDILDVSVNELAQLPGLQRKMAEKLFKSLHDKLTKTDITLLMAASNLFGAGLGSRRAQSLLDAMPDFLRRPYRTEQDRANLLRDIMAIPGFKEITGGAMVQGLPYFIPFLYGVYRVGWISTFLARPGVGAPVTVFPASNSHRSLGDRADDALDDLRATGRAEYDQTDFDFSSDLQNILWSDIDEQETARKATLLKAPPMLKGALRQLPKREQKPSLLGKAIVFTGVHKGLEGSATERGAVVKKSVSGNTDILVKKDSAWTSGKVTKAEGLGTTIMTVDEFRETYL